MNGCFYICYICVWNGVIKYLLVINVMFEVFNYIRNLYVKNLRK